MRVKRIDVRRMQGQRTGHWQAVYMPLRKLLERIRLLDVLSHWKTEEGGLEEWREKMRSTGNRRDSVQRLREQLVKKQWKGLEVLTERIVERVRPPKLGLEVILKLEKSPLLHVGEEMELLNKRKPVMKSMAGFFAGKISTKDIVEDEEHVL